jgi:hypothetical protein
VLGANLLVPTDLGGFYAVRPDVGAALLDSAPCLAGLSPSPSQSGRAVTGLVGPDYGPVPEILEVVMSYPGSAANGVYQSLTTAMQACSSFAVSLAGTAVRVPIASESMPTLGDRSAAWQGQFTIGGRTQQLGVAVALSGQKVFCVMFIDTVPRSNAIYGDLASTVSAAIGKEA